MHLQEDTVFECTYKVWRCYIQRFRVGSIYKKIHYLTFDRNLGIKVTRNIVQYPLHQNFKKTRSLFDFDIKGTQNIGQYPLHYVENIICTDRSCNVQWFRSRCIYKTIYYLTIDLYLRNKVTTMLPNTLFITWLMQLRKCIILHVYVYIWNNCTFIYTCNLKLFNNVHLLI